MEGCEQSGDRFVLLGNRLGKHRDGPVTDPRRESSGLKTGSSPGSSQRARSPLQAHGPWRLWVSAGDGQAESSCGPQDVRPRRPPVDAQHGQVQGEAGLLSWCFWSLSFLFSTWAGLRRC